MPKTITLRICIRQVCKFQSAFCRRTSKILPVPALHSKILHSFGKGSMGDFCCQKCRPFDHGLLSRSSFKVLNGLKDSFQFLAVALNLIYHDYPISSNMNGIARKSLSIRTDWLNFPTKNPDGVFSSDKMEYGVIL